MPDRSAHRSGGRILVVDDEPHIRRILNTVLTNEGFEVIEAFDGSIGLDMIASDEPFDFVILELMMPGATGLEVLSHLRGLEHRKSTPVVMLTAKGQDADREQAFSLGANDFLTKPFSPKKLLARIHEILQGS